MPTPTIFPSKLNLSQFVVSVTASYPVCLNVHCKKTMIVVYLKFWIMILKVLLLNLEYKLEQFNDLHFSSKMKPMWNPDCDLAVRLILSILCVYNLKIRCGHYSY